MIVWARLTVIASKLIALVYLFFMARQTSLVFLGLSVFVVTFDYICYLIQNKNVKTFAQDCQKIQGDSSELLLNLITNMENLAFNNISKRYIDKYLKSRESFFKVESKKLKTSITINASGDLFGALSKYLLFFNLSFLATNSLITTGAIISVFAIFDSIRESAKQMRNDLIELQYIFTPSEILDEFLKIKMNNIAIETKLTRDIEVVNLSLSLNGKKILSEISLEIMQGEKVAIIGENGSGKTALIRSMMGLYLPNSGNVFIKNTHSSSFSYEEDCNIVSYIPIENQLFTGSIRENIIMGGFYEDISELTKMFNIDYSSGTNIKNLSGGEAKRINICRGLMSEKHILFADEPTASLDKANSARVMNKLLNSSNTVVVVTHDLNQLKYFDSVYEIKECKVWKRK